MKDRKKEGGDTEEKGGQARGREVGWIMFWQARKWSEKRIQKRQVPHVVGQGRHVRNMLPGGETLCPTPCSKSPVLRNYWDPQNRCTEHVHLDLVILEMVKEVESLRRILEVDQLVV